jgi:predicted nuclease of predicted toxin-antitoxin system
VKFLVDANLPPRLCVWLKSQRHEAEHVFDRNLLTATDTQIWERGRLESLVIFSKDTDFYDRALLYGAPPQVLHVAVGNCSNARLFSVLASEWKSRLSYPDVDWFQPFNRQASVTRGSARFPPLPGSPISRQVSRGTDIPVRNFLIPFFPRGLCDSLTRRCFQSVGVEL